MAGISNKEARNAICLRFGSSLEVRGASAAPSQRQRSPPGDKVLATVRVPARLQDLVHCYGSRIRTVQHDIRKASVAVTAVQIAVDAFDRLDVVVNAARSADPAVEDFSVESFRVPIETNLFGFASLIDATLPILRQQRSGHITGISPEGSFIPSLGFSGYHISKDAIEDFTLDLAQKVAPFDQGSHRRNGVHAEYSFGIIRSGGQRTLQVGRRRHRTTGPGS
jgi:NAD(P)-dependent dehydrogenase (short-subunit alcohol dehydrogenase family)